MTALLGWIGGRARWLLVIGAFIGLAAPDVAAFLRPALPVFISMVYALAMLRVEPAEIWRGLSRPAEALRAALAVFAMLVVAPALGFLAVRLLGLGSDFEAAVVYTLAAPPIASAAAMCLLVGFSGALALRLTVLASLAMPVTGPLAAEALVGASLDISPLTLGLRMAAMIGGGIIAALILRRVMGRARIERNAAALDGVAAIGFLLFILPLFDGVRGAILAAPQQALAFLALASAIIVGGVALALRAPGGRAQNGAAGVVSSTRSVAIFLAALPPDPAFALYVALYQFPMAAIPLVFQRTKSPIGARSPRKP